MRTSGYRAVIAISIFFLHAGTGCSDKPPSPFWFFPETGLVADSFGYKAAGVLGIEGLNNAYSARYRVGANDVEVYLIRETSTESARETAALARRAVGSMSAIPPRPVFYRSIRAWAIKTLNLGIIWVIDEGSDIVLVKGTDDSTWLGPFVVELFDRLNNRMPQNNPLPEGEPESGWKETDG